MNGRKLCVCHTATAFIVNDFGSEEMGAFIVKWFGECGNEGFYSNKLLEIGKENFD